MKNKDVKASCGSQGCDIQVYVLPIAGTKEHTDKVVKEKTKEQNKKAA